MYDYDKEWCDADVTDPKEVQAKLDRAVSAIEQSPEEQGRLVATLVDLALYSGRPFTAITMADLWSYAAIADAAATLKFNACYSVVSTIVSRICSFRPRAQFIPEAGNYKTQRLCRERTAASDAWCQREEYQAQAAYAFRDCLTGTGGVLKTYQETLLPGTDEESIVTCLGRFPSWEIKVDDEDGKYGKPECMYHVRYITPKQAMRVYGRTDAERAQIVSGAERLASLAGYTGADGLNGLARRNGRPLVRVVDAYARGPKGRHVVMVGDLIVWGMGEDGKQGAWKHQWHPFDVLRFDHAEGTGFWGRSALDKVRGIQAGLDETIYEIDQAHHLSSKLFCAGPSAPEKMTNDIVQYVVDTPGRPYTFHNPKPIDPDAYRWFEIKKQWMFEVLGVSPNAAQATKPQGVTAAVAIEAVTDLQSDRLSQCSQGWETLVCGVGEKWYALESDVAGDEPREYRSQDRGRVSVIRMKADGKQQTVRAFPTSLFGQSIPARLQKAMDAVKAGWFDQEDVLRALGVPDLESILEIKLAEFEWIEQFADNLLEGGQYVTPIEWVNPIKCFEYCRLRYLRADADGSYPPDSMYDMRKLLDYLQPIAQAARDKAAGKAPALPAGASAPALAAPPSPLALGPGAAPPAPIAAPPLPGLSPSPEAAPIA
jgi:hypothetical protein